MFGRHKGKTVPAEIPAIIEESCSHRGEKTWEVVVTNGAGVVRAHTKHCTNECASHTLKRLSAPLCVQYCESLHGYVRPITS